MFTNEQEAYYTVILFSLFALLLITIIIIAAVLYYNRRKKHANETRMMQSAFQEELLRTQIEIQEQTLKNISQEIHDNIGQVLSLAKLNLNTFPPTTQPDILARANDTKQLVSKAIHDLRDLSRSMHGDRLTEIGLKTAIENELKILENTGQYKTAFQVNGTPFKLEVQQETVLFRMVQESLNNIIKHAKAKNITVAVSYLNHRFVLSVTDDGQGFNAAGLSAVDKGIGLKSMESRAGLIGGEFSISSSAGKGTTIAIELPDILG